MIKLDIIADFVCPWCYIGKAMLDRALAEHPDHPFTLEWHPFLLDPGLPDGGLDRKEYMAAKFGDEAGIIAAHRPLLEIAEALGVDFDLPAIRRTPHTLDAHRLVHWAGLEDRQPAMVAALYRGYWAEGRDIGDAATLATMAGEVGMDAALVTRLLASEADKRETLARIAHSTQRGVRSIPTFIVANQHVLSGAQEPALWGRVIEEINTQIARLAPEAKADSTADSPAAPAANAPGTDRLQ